MVGIQRGAVSQAWEGLSEGRLPGGGDSCVRVPKDVESCSTRTRRVFHVEGKSGYVWTGPCEHLAQVEKAWQGADGRGVGTRGWRPQCQGGTVTKASL